jgi:hypothetical protein
MAFVNEYISPEDREHYRFDDFEKRLFMINPQDSWAIDREQDIFLRVIRPAARGSEPGDPNARFEKDFHFHWKGYDYMVSTSRKDAQELEAIQAETFQSDNPRPEGARVLHFFLLHIGETKKPRLDAPSALRTQRQALLNDLEYVLAFGSGGTFARLTPSEAAQPRYAILKIASNAEVA